MPYNKSTPEGLKKSIIYRWKYRGLIGDYDLIYDIYLNNTNCQICNCEYSGVIRKCMDHDHKTRLFRCICCNNCNITMPDKSISSNNRSGIKNIKYENPHWMYRKITDSKKFNFSNKNKQLVLWVKFYHYLNPNIETNERHKLAIKNISFYQGVKWRYRKPIGDGKEFNYMNTNKQFVLWVKFVHHLKPNVKKNKRSY